MTKNVWQDLHQKYTDEDWINQPSRFAETALQYFPPTGHVLDLGAGQGQDSRFFAKHGYDVVSTDLEPLALKLSRQKTPDALKGELTFQQLDLSQEFPFEDASFDIVYAHLSLHYFDHETTLQIFSEIYRVLKPGGLLAFFVNSTSDSQYGAGKRLEADFFQIDQVTKRFFSIETTRAYTKWFEVNLLDNLGETYKDRRKGVHNLIRFIGRKPLDLATHKMAVPFVGGIIERWHHGTTEVLMQTRWQPNGDPIYSGTLEFPAGTLDVPYENIYDALSREIKEECGLVLKQIKNDSQTKKLRPRSDDEAFGFRPFCCVQQLKNGKPWIGFIFICEVEAGSPKAQLTETKDPKWMPVEAVRQMYDESSEKFFTLEIPAWEYYFNQR